MTVPWQLERSTYNLLGRITSNFIFIFRQFFGIILSHPILIIVSLFRRFRLGKRKRLTQFRGNTNNFRSKSRWAFYSNKAAVVVPLLRDQFTEKLLDVLYF